MGDEHPSTLISINNFGGLLQKQGKLAEAEPLLREGLEGSRRALGDAHRDTLIAINGMSSLLQELGQLEEAERLAAEAVRGARRELPAGHWFTAVFLTQHARTLAAMEHIDEAESSMLEAHAIFESSLGPDHHRTTSVIKLLTDFYDRRHKEAPDSGGVYDAKAAEWRAKLEISEPPTTDPPE